MSEWVSVCEASEAGPLMMMSGGRGRGREGENSPYPPPIQTNHHQQRKALLVHLMLDVAVVFVVVVGTRQDNKTQEHSSIRREGLWDLWWWRALEKRRMRGWALG